MQALGGLGAPGAALVLQALLPLLSMAVQAVEDAIPPRGLRVAHSH